VPVATSATRSDAVPRRDRADPQVGVVSRAHGTAPSLYASRLSLL